MVLMELMHSQLPAWEQELLRLALIVHPHEIEHAPRAHEHELFYPPSWLEQSGYALAERATRDNSKSFYFASGLLPPTKRRAARVLYAFCRVTDDLVDKAQGTAAMDLDEWRERSLAAHPPAGDALLNAWFQVRARYRIPRRYVRQLIDGIGLDLTQKRYGTFEELAKYCYGVASTVGLMAMHIIGYRDPAAIPYAVKLGVALQLTNILRDIGEDFRRGRVYLPQQDLARFGYTERDLARGVVDSRFRRLMDFEIRRTKTLYAEAWDGIRLLSPDGRLAIAAAADLYRRILDKIIANDYDVFRSRAHLGTMEKLARVPALWWGLRRTP
jgi:phytoene synthase